MKNLFFLVLSVFELWLCPAYSQTEYTLRIKDDIAVTFPDTPDFTDLGGNGRQLYTCKANGCGYVLGVKPDAIKDYSRYLQLTKTEQANHADSVVAGFVYALLSTRKKTLISRSRFFLAHGLGWSVKYSEPDPTDAEKPIPRLRYVKVLTIGSTLYTIECWFWDEKDHESEKDKFFASVSLKE